MKSNLPDSTPDVVAIYHVILQAESLSTGAGHLLELLQKAQRESPGQPRKLLLDIDGRRTDSGAFVPEVQVFLSDVVRGFFAQFVVEIGVAGSTLVSTGTQRDDIPSRLPVR